MVCYGARGEVRVVVSGCRVAIDLLLDMLNNGRRDNAEIARIKECRAMPELRAGIAAAPAAGRCFPLPRRLM
jgi:hypothetical protein